jgi:GntR family transcriptional regulator, transcriptional repressor for pyruvate dehydrogenase complex
MLRDSVESKRMKTKKTYEQVADKIKRMIEQGQLEPGEKLPPMYELAAQFGVSRATVREAFSSLVGMGLIDLRHGEGTFVRRIDVQTMITEPMNAALLLGLGDLRELLEVRRMLETGLVRMACQRADDRALAAIRTALQALEAGARSDDERAGGDLQFHLAIAEASGNTVLFNLMNTMAESIRSLLREAYGVAEEPGLFHEQHGEILAAIEQRDGEGAARLMGDHLAATEELVRELKAPKN